MRLHGSRVLDYVPMWFRMRWPLRRYYWQADEIERAEVIAERFRACFASDSEPGARSTRDEA